MVLHPSIIVVLLLSLLISLMMLYSSFFGLKIIRKWELTSGDELQITLERRTYLVSAMLAYAFIFQLLSLFLYVYTAENLHSLFAGAMCAAGTLHVNKYGYPVLILKVFNFLLSGIWLVLNYADNRGYDYPLIKKKYALLLAIAPFILTETILLTAYFLNLRADVITSCCGTLFSIDAESITSEVAALPSIPMKILLYSCMALTFTTGVYFYLKGKAGYLFPLTSFITFVVSIASIISFVSLYYYELPTHHCPFCILQKEYGHIGYPLYITLLGGAVSGAGVGVLMPFQKIISLKETIPLIQRRLTVVSLVLYLIFSILTTYEIITSALVLEGY